MEDIERNKQNLDSEISNFTESISHSHNKCMDENEIYLKDAEATLIDDISQCQHEVKLRSETDQRTKIDNTILTMENTIKSSNDRFTKHFTNLIKLEKNLNSNYEKLSKEVSIRIQA